LTQGPVSTVEPQEIRPGVQRLEGWAQSVKLLAIKRVPWQIDIRAAMGAACCMYLCPLDGPLFPSRAVDQGPERASCSVHRGVVRPRVASLSQGFQLLVDEDHGSSDGLAGRPAACPPLLKGIRARFS
jgi:hypothetical protein